MSARIRWVQIMCVCVKQYELFLVYEYFITYARYNYMQSMGQKLAIKREKMSLRWWSTDYIKLIWDSEIYNLKVQSVSKKTVQLIWQRVIFELNLQKFVYNLIRGRWIRFWNQILRFHMHSGLKIASKIEKSDFAVW